MSFNPRRSQPVLVPGSTARPAAGAGTHYRRQLGRLLDALGTAAVACEESGRVVHQTPAMSALLIAEPEADRLLDAVRSVVEESLAQTSQRKDGVHSITGPAREVATGRSRYVVRGVIHDPGLATTESLVLAVVEHAGPRLRTEADLRERYALTAAEVRVALLLARGRQNTEIAAALDLSPHTVRRHTERILAKLRVRSRSEVGVLLHE